MNIYCLDCLYKNNKTNNGKLLWPCLDCCNGDRKKTSPLDTIMIKLGAWIKIKL